MEISPDFSDSHFCVFRASPAQIKKILEGMKFSGRAQIPESEFALLNGMTQEAVPVSVYFMRNKFQAFDASQPALRKKDDIFVSVEQRGRVPERVFDWHILTDPAQEKQIEGIIRRWGDIHYLSGDSIIFSTAGNGLSELMRAIGGLGGVFPDFGRPEPYEDAAFARTVSILVYFKKQ